jgi:glycosyltransferase involved in cell wall biosynthesis
MTSFQSLAQRLPRSSEGVRPDFLVVGHAGFTAINRNVYVCLARQGWSVEMAIPRFVPGFDRAADPQRPEDPPIHWVKIGGITNQRFWNFNGVTDVLERRHPRAIFLEADPASRLAIRVSKWARRNGVPLLCYTNENNLISLGRSLFHARLPAAVRTLRSMLLARFSRPGIAHVFVVCNAAANSMKILGFKDRISKMPLGIDPSVFHVDAEARQRIRTQKNLHAPVITYIGRISEGKGIEYLIEALGMLVNLEWHFLIDDFSSAERGDYADRIQKMIGTNPSLAARLQRFHADHYEIADYINAADIIVAPSCLPEQYGRILAEAMACGKLVVASDAGAYSEIVGDCGIIVPMADTSALATALRRALENPSLAAELGRKAATRAHDELTIDVQAGIIARELQETLGGPALVPGFTQNVSPVLRE